MSDSISPVPVWRWRLLAALLILGSAAWRIAYLAYDCSLDLAPDEAHYWDWSRRLGWSYYSKGPLVAYLIRAGCLAAGDWSQRLIGSEMLAVRLPAVVCGVLLLLSLYELTRRIWGDERLAATVVAGALTLPLLVAGSMLMTIDAPYACCWGWALVVGHQAVFRRSPWAWPLLGLLIALGILAKYTMVLFVPSFGLFLLTSRPQRSLLFQPGFWAMTAIAALGGLPILLWNAQHGWVSFHHVQGLAGLGESDAGVRWLGPLAYLGAQCGLLLVFWFFVWVAAMVAHRPWVEPEPQLRYLWWLSAPTFLVFLAFSLKTGGGEVNWPVMAYLSGLLLGAAHLRQRLRERHGWRRGLLLAGLSLSCVVGVALTLLAQHSDRVVPLLARLVPARPEDPLPVRRFDPTARLRGWRTLAAVVDEVRAEVAAAEGREPLLAGSGWTLPGEVAFYCTGHPVVYSLGLGMGDRYSQYDCWRPNPVLDPGAFAGRTFIVVGFVTPRLAAAFEQIEPPRHVWYCLHGCPVSVWAVTVCRGYRGFPQLPARPRH